MATINGQQVRGNVIGCGVLIGVVILAFILAGCGRPIDTGTSASTVSQATASTSPAAAPAVEQPPAAEPGPAVSADPPAAPENCAEMDPKKWLGFSYSITAEDVTIRNSSTCDRHVTFRAFIVRSDSDQPPAGDAVFAVIPAGAGFGAPGSRLERPWVLKLHYYGGTLPCGVTIQVDGRPGNQPSMGHLNASFVAGRTFSTPACGVIITPPRTTPPVACVDPGFGPWLPVTPSSSPTFRAMVHVCEPMERRRTLCSGLVQVEPRPANWCFEQ